MPPGRVGWPGRDTGGMAHHLPDSRYAWIRLAATLAAMTLGSSAMYVVSVVLPTV